MTDFLIRVLWETWNIFRQASVFLLFGFLIAGVLAVIVPEKTLARLFRTGKLKSVLWASTIGAPLPLCSCGVVPAAIGLRRQGANPGATVAFLIATPETGADSISLTYALMDPITTVARPVAAVTTAITAGICTNLFGTPKNGEAQVPPSSGEMQSQAAHSHDLNSGDHHAHYHAADPASEPQAGQGLIAEGGAEVWHTVKRIYHYAFRQLLDETGYWIVLGIVLSAVIAAAVPPTFFERYLDNELASMLVMLLIGIPIYVCASEATPLAAALVLKGLNPGAALVFLLAGPATNIGSIVLLLKFLGARVMAIYLGSIAVVALLAGFALNWIYRAWGIDPRATFGTATAFLPESVKVGAALLLIILLVLSMRRTPVPAEWIWLRDRFASRSGLRLTTAGLTRAAAVVAAVLYVGSGLFTVQPGEVGVQMRFGRIIESDLEPGLHYRLPWPFEAQRVIAKDTVQRIEFGFPGKKTQMAAQPIGRPRTAAGWTPTPDVTTATGSWFQKEADPDEPYLLTGDGNLIDLRWAVQFRIKDAVAYTFNVAESDRLVRGASLAALRSVVARSGIDAIYTSERSGVESQVEETLQRVLDDTRSGVEILSFQLLYVHPPGEVHDAFRDVASSQEDKLRTINRANIFAVETVNQAKAEAAAMIEQALALKDQQILHAQGDAGGFGLKLRAYQRAPGLTRFRLQVESIEETLPGLQKFVMPGAGDVKDLDMWLLQPPGMSRGK
ncbi:MAG TPA: SO_0444 family Cu/Zn efflux transporter [Burkholderiales bacterium]|nr:SO_0444 family Cu/Zn efflux transporter [Burkholderiales bacterium]